jgi:acetyl/propionyl-CoA carboxylase alpha subunit
MWRTAVSGHVERLFIANRGEVAVRVARTCRRLGIGSVAAVAPDDRGSLHARSADRVSEVTGYLDAGELVRAAVAAGADAIHPGWGFLAESPELAEETAAAGLLWVGPPAGAMRLAGDKLEAKRAAARAGVPTLPSGSAGEVGLPLLIKAAGGGGGRGMRLVRERSELEPALEAARREARNAFGDDRVYCERYLEGARHVEVQILADRHGAVACLGERDCSIQRRHQKLLEETPSPGLEPAGRASIAAAAGALARAVGYENAGTAEFLATGDGFWFIELNARLQVEHPVTELVTGLDLVAQQLRLAAGEPLGTLPEPRGHAVEVRLYAEHPVTFHPQAGRVERLRLPGGVRVDAGVEEGDAVAVAYDPLLAKLVAGAGARDEALDRLDAAVRATEIGGVTTNLPFLRWLVSNPTVRAGEATTDFLTLHPPLQRTRPARGPFAGWWRPARDPSEPRPLPAPPPQVEPGGHAAPAPGEESAVAAPMPGVVLEVLATEGEKVEARQPLVVLEAMKMETPVLCPFDAVVGRVRVTAGDRVAVGDVLVELA